MKEEYISQAEEFLKKAEEELSCGDIRQASEKYWGAAAHIVKALTEKRGWRRHNGHAWLFEVVSKISKEKKDDALEREFGLAGMLHTNFYEGWLTEDEVKNYSEQVKKFLLKEKISLIVSL